MINGGNRITDIKILKNTAIQYSKKQDSSCDSKKTVIRAFKVIGLNFAGSIMYKK